METNFVRIVRGIVPSAFVVVGLVATFPTFAAQTGTNTMIRPGAQTGTNSVKPSAQTGTNVMVHPGAQTGTNSVRPSAQTGTNGFVRSSSDKKEEQCEFRLSFSAGSSC